MEHKGILILLVVVALLVGVAIMRGHQRDRSDKPVRAQDSPGKGFGGLDKVLGGFRKPLDIKRVIGCGRAERLLTAAPGGSCDAVIIPLPGAPRVSTFKLKPQGAGPIEACFALDLKQFDKCLQGSDDNKPQQLKAENDNRMTVGRDSAFLRLYCRAPSAMGACRVSVE
jgi:hypothetical protein